MKVYLNNIKESWVVDRLKNEWYEFNEDLSTKKIKDADIVWIFAPWLLSNVRKKHLKKKKVICSIYHIDFEKFSTEDKQEFEIRDSFVDVYHVISEKTKLQLKKLTNKRIVSIPFWINQNIWHYIEEKEELKSQLDLSFDKEYIGSFQRDTEGADLTSPKLIKGPDRFIDIVSSLYEENKNIEIILTGKRRQYVLLELEKRSIPFKYFEMITFEEMNKLYNILDLYIVSSRIEGGPQAILECAITKTPIISTNVGVASEILSSKSIYDMSNFKDAEPDVKFAYEKSQDYIIPKGFLKFRELIKEIYES